MLFKRILCPTDFSEESRRALDLAGALAHEQGSQLLLLHAVETLGPENVSYLEAASQIQPEAYRRRLWDELHQVKPSYSDIPVEYILSEEAPSHAIVHAAADHGCDLIVMSSHGRRGLRRLFLGSVAERVVRTAGCPVLVVKPIVTAARAGAAKSSELHPRELFDDG